MKNLLIIVCIVLGFASCGPSKAELEAKAAAIADSTEQAIEMQSHDTAYKKSEVSEVDYKIIIIDECQYILFPQTYKYWNEWYNHTRQYTTYSIIHKANCSNSFHLP